MCNNGFERNTLLVNTAETVLLSVRLSPRRYSGEAATFLLLLLTSIPEIGRHLLLVHLFWRDRAPFDHPVRMRGGCE